jgi:hypothetical protein
MERLQQIPLANHFRGYALEYGNYSNTIPEDAITTAEEVTNTAIKSNPI